ncbi:MAG: DinB family protein [Phycisphaerales bacterium JB039]
MAPSLSALARAHRTLVFAHEAIVRLVDDFPPEQAAFQACPTDNHLLWQLGHVALDYRWFAAAIDGAPTGTTEQEAALFGPGSRPAPDAGAYPPLAQLRARLDESWQRLGAAAEGLRDQDAAQPPRADTGGLLTDRLDAVEKAAWHSGWHAGQISGLRRALGLGPVLF